MPKLTIEGHGTHEAAEGQRLLVALLDAGVDILHRCGGYSKCTTCRVEFLEGEPERMTVAEHDKLTANEQLGEFRLSCQCIVSEDMHVRPMLNLADSGLDDAGPPVEEHMTPDPVWVGEAVEEEADSDEDGADEDVASTDAPESSGDDEDAPTTD